MYLIEIKTNNGHGCWWKATYEGDPGRTRVESNATQFGKKKNAQDKIKFLVKKYPNREFSLDAI